MRVQVKASNKLMHGKQACYKFMTHTKNNELLSADYIDIVAFVDLAQRRALFACPADLQKTVRLNATAFDNIDNERVSWETAVNKVLGK